MKNSKTISRAIIYLLLFSVFIFFFPRQKNNATIIFGSEVTVMTLQSSDNIDSLDYDLNTKRNWYCIFNNDKIIDLIMNNENALKSYNQRCISVDITYINLFIFSGISYIKNANVPYIYIYKIKYNGECL